MVSRLHHAAGFSLAVAGLLLLPLAAAAATPGATAAPADLPFAASGSRGEGGIPPPPGTDAAALARRATLLRWHQVLGPATVLTGIGTLVTGVMDAGKPGISTTHATLSATTTALYAATASLAFLAPPAPPPLEGVEQHLDSTQIHKGLAFLHGAGMLATVGLGVATAQTDGPGGERESLRTAHQVAAGVTLAALIAAELVILLP